ncbi:MAG: glycosyltransferase family 1 protein [Jaaginema sp. PMC 1080.18]|nr:glycosyltransferase family 1 protein [Jaaginema sp. PMC 1080.18]MEC4867495.1 glycosyltransferase family 1 protein [Jaaginema sp. PMC 1078.18]
MSDRVIQIVPTLPPIVDGLGDYALNLARQLRQSQIETEFIVGDPEWQGDRCEDFKATVLTRRSASDLLALLPRDRPILLHYSGYGYAKRGVPQWLISALQQRRENHLVTMFHEVYTYDRGPFWSSSFWLSPLQKQLAKQLIQRSDRLVTNRESYAQLIQQLSPQPHLNVTVLPVFSNLGEPKVLKPLQQRQRRLIILGHRNTRQRTYTQYSEQLQQACQALNITQIYDIGKPLEEDIQSISPCPVIKMGVTPATQISEIMQDAIAGFLSFPPPEYLGKSSIFAAYCAHGLIPILANASPFPVEGLVSGIHYWVAQKHPLLESTIITIRDNALSWYNSHNLTQQQSIFTTLLTQLK